MNASIRILVLLVTLPAWGETFHVYVGDVTTTTAILAWGTTSGSGNTIGRDSKSLGDAVVQIDGKEYETKQNWMQVKNLAPDHDYPYRVLVNGRAIGGGAIRTLPEHATRMSFFVIGDYGNASGDQEKLAAVMRREFLRKVQTDDPVRFVITTGDNLYGWGVSAFGFTPLLWGSGDKDSHWESRFFGPYLDILRYVPWYPSLGNHDGDESESRGDLAAYLDNFFFPGGHPARYYQFSFADLADFFCLDTTTSVLGGSPAPGTGPDSEQTRWLEGALKASKAKWKIVYFHNPPFTAGPLHGASLDELRHWVDLFKQTGVNVVFNGHEHNFQWAEKNDITGNVQYVVSGSGGQLRDGDIRKNMKKAGIQAWAGQTEFLLVQIRNNGMDVTPYSTEAVAVETSDGKPVELPLHIPWK